MKILITGSNGYIGSSIGKFLSQDANFELTLHSRTMFDLADQQAVYNHFKHNAYDVVLHAASIGGSRLNADDSIVLQNNLKCFYNLYDNRENFGKLISFGSGSEFNKTITPYSLSKRCINAQIQSTKNFYNLRVYAVFDENELNTRFIKSSINNYLYTRDLTIHQNKYMDFFAMQDLIALVRYICTTEDNVSNRVIDCCYDHKYTLSDIANYINALSNYRCNIVTQQPGLGENYTGYSNTLPCFDQIGLFAAINQMYNKLKNEKQDFYSGS